MEDVFLSYSLTDAGAAGRLVEQLRRAGVTVFWDRDLAVDTSVEQGIASALAEAKVFVLLHPKQLGSSSFLQRETQAALVRSTSTGLPVLPVMLPGREPTGDVGDYRYVRVSSENDFDPVVNVVLDLLRETRPKRSRSVAAQRLSFLAALLHTDLPQAPQAAAVVLDEIAQTVGGGSQHVALQLELLRDALAWAEMNLGSEHRSTTSLRFRLAQALLKSRRYDESLALSRQTLDASTTPTDRLEASLNLGHAMLEGGRREESRQLYEQSLVLARTTDSLSAEATSLVALGTLARMNGELSQAESLYAPAVDLTSHTSQPTARIEALIGLCEVTTATGDSQARTRYAQEALWLSETVGDDDLARRAAALLEMDGGEK